MQTSQDRVDQTHERDSFRSEVLIWRDSVEQARQDWFQTEPNITDLQARISHRLLAIRRRLLAV